MCGKGYSVEEKGLRSGPENNWGDLGRAGDKKKQTKTRPATSGRRKKKENRMRAGDLKNKTNIGTGWMPRMEQTNRRKTNEKKGNQGKEQRQEGVRMKGDKQVLEARKDIDVGRADATKKKVKSGSSVTKACQTGKPVTYQTQPTKKKTNEGKNSGSLSRKKQK